MILNRTLPFDPSQLRALPGILPLGDAPWLLRTEVHAAQMALRDALLRDRPGDVCAALPGTQDAVQEMLELALAHAPEGYHLSPRTVERPDGQIIDRALPPLVQLTRLFQEDFCLMMKAPGAGEHHLAAATLCFPSGWTLAQKIGRPLHRIHRPVAVYDDNIARRVQRLFDGVQPGRPLWRFNLARHADPALYQPRAEDMPHPAAEAAAPRFLRLERQVILRLPRSGAVVFSIHSFVLPDTAAHQA